MNPTNPTRLSPNLDPGGPTRPNSTRIWTLRAQPDPKSGSNRVYLVHYRVEPEYEPYLRPTRPDWTRFLTMRANPTRLNPNFGSKIGFNPKKRVGFGRTSIVASRSTSWLVTPHVTKFQLIRTTNKKVLFLKKKFGMLVFETLKNKKSDFLNSNTCFCSRLYGRFFFEMSKVAFFIVIQLCYNELWPVYH
jgi:hypothetical protein